MVKSLQEGPPQQNDINNKKKNQITKRLLRKYEVDPLKEEASGGLSRLLIPRSTAR